MCLYSGCLNRVLLLLCVVPKTLVLYTNEHVVPTDLLPKEPPGTSTQHYFGGT